MNTSCIVSSVTKTPFTSITLSPAFNGSCCPYSQALEQIKDSLVIAKKMHSF